MLKKIVQPSSDEVKVIHDDRYLGVMTVREAIEMAAARGLDLVDTGSKAKPPVVRIGKFDSLRYEAVKQARAGRHRPNGIKVHQIGLFAAAHDVETVVRKATVHLEGGHRVSLEMKLRGRQLGRVTDARTKLDGVVRQFRIPVRVVGGQGNPPVLSVIIAHEAKASAT